MCARVPFGRTAPSCRSPLVQGPRAIPADLCGGGTGVSHLASQGAIPGSLVAKPQCHLRATTLMRVVSSVARAIVGVSVESREWLKLRRRGAHL